MKKIMDGGMVYTILLIAALVFLPACVTSPQDSNQRQGEGNKDMALSMFDSVSTTRASAKLKEGEATRGGNYEEPVTYQEIVEEPYEVQVPVVDEEGNPVLDDEGNPTFKTETRVRKKIVVKPVLGPDGKPLTRKAAGFRNLVLNYGSISQHQTSSGETSGTNTQNPTSQPTNTVEPNTELQGPGN